MAFTRLSRKAVFGLVVAVMGVASGSAYVQRYTGIPDNTDTKMQSPASVLLLCMLTGSTCAVFYTKSNDNDYPRIGRRSFYTSGNGNHYPRIGRRDAAGSRLLLPGSADFSGFPGLDKRGVFTQGAYGYPRVGRSGTDMLGSEDLLAQRSSKLLEKFAAGLSKHEEEEEDVIGKELQGSPDGDDVGPLNYPLSLMFLAFDTDSDGKLTKEEFTSGMKKYRENNPLF